MTGLFIGGMCAIGGGELLKACGIPQGKGYVIVTKISAVAVGVGFALWETDLTLMSVALLLTISLFLLAILQFQENMSVNYQLLCTCIFGGFIFPVFFSTLILLRRMELGTLWVLLPLVTSFSADSGAYFMGVAFGKHRGVTQVSPNKSREGYIGGLVWGVCFVSLYGYLIESFTQLPTNIPVFALYGLIGAFVTALGDLSFSLIKRQTGIKDFGTLIAGHGGILDRFDGMCLSAPTLYLLFQIFPPYTLTESFSLVENTLLRGFFS